MSKSLEAIEPEPKKPNRPFRRAVLRGLAILMPPLLTVALFIWAASVVETSVLNPVEGIAGMVIAELKKDTRDSIPDDAIATRESGEVVSYKYGNRSYTRNGRGQWVGRYDDEYIKDNFLKRQVVLPLFISLFVLVAYLLGKFVAANIGRMIVHSFEGLIGRLPVISNVYSSVKQVTDFIFVEQEIEFNRVVAVQYPRKGIWSVGFVTGESMLDIRSAANEPVLSVLMPTSPMPVTGFTITVSKSEAIDLNITIDQAIQFVVSCGVVVPAQQQQPKATLPMAISAAIAQHGGTNGQSENGKSGQPRKDAVESAD